MNTLENLAVGIIVLLLFAADLTAQEPAVVEGNEQQKYFLIGDPAENAPEGGWGVLVVLPGGDGSAGFHPFVKNIARNVAPEGYLTVQLVAVQGDENLTWPTKRSVGGTRKQDFTTEQHTAAVLKQIAADLPEGVTLNPKKRLVMAWSSGGPAAYAMMANEDLGFAGAFIAMSIFSIREIQPSAPLEGKHFALLQSPQDRVTPWAHVVQAEAALTKAGAEVWKRGYAGGHGWQGDSLEKLRAGLKWLAEQAAAAPTTQTE